MHLLNRHQLTVLTLCIYFPFPPWWDAWWEDWGAFWASGSSDLDPQAVAGDAAVAAGQSGTTWWV